MTRGFTLIETIIYLGLFSIIMVGVLNSTYSLIESGERNQDAISIQEEGTFISRKLNWAVSGSTDADVVSGALILTRSGLPSGENPLTFEFEPGEGILFIRRGTGISTPLNSDAFEISNVVFSVLPASAGRPTSVKATYWVDGVPFTFSAYLRK